MRKLTMPSRAADAGKLCACLIGLAAVPAWALAQAPPAKPEPAKTPDVTAVFKWVDVSPKPAEDSETRAIQDQIKALTAKLEMLRRARQDAEQAKAHAAQVEAQQKLLNARLQEAMSALKGPAARQKLVAGQNGVKVIGPDGKEIPGVIVIIEPPAGAGAGAKAPPATAATPRNTLFVVDPNPGKMTDVNPAAPTASAGPIALSRATYKLPKDQAAALALLLSGLKHTVMETKAENDTLVVTTTPEAQATVQRFVWMLTGDKTYGYRAGEGVQRFMFSAGTDGKPVRIDLTEPAQPWATELEKGLGGLRLRLDAESKPKPADVRKTEAKPAAPTAPEPTKKP